MLAIHSANWRDSGRSEKIWRARMRDYVLPQLGRKRVDAITSSDVLSVLLPHWATKRETMRRTKQRLSRIFRWAIAENYRTDDPAGATLDAALPRNGRSTRHFTALPHGEVAAAIATVRNSEAWLGTKAAFEFLVLTACRSGEVRLAEGREVDLGSGIWTIPADRSKTRREHKVPLAPRALAVLDEARKLSHGKGLIFPSGHRQAAVGRDDLKAGPGARHPSSPTRIPVVIPRLVRRDGPAARSCRGVLGACRQEQGRGGLCAIGPAQSTSDPDAGLGGLSFRDGPPVNAL